MYLYAARHHHEHSFNMREARRGRILRWAASGLVVGLILFAVIQASLTLRDVTSTELLTTVKCAGATFLRVLIALVLGSAWTIPVGVAIGFSPKLARVAQPLAQIAASVPATALFPVVLLALVSVGGGLTVGSVLLMLLGTQWYILFNVIAGAMAIPSEFREVSEIFRFSRLDRWRTVILPGIFPYLLTGLGYGERRGVEREHRGRVLPLQRQSAVDVWARLADQLRHRRGQLLAAAAVHGRNGDARGEREPPAVEAAVPGRRETVPVGAVRREG